MRAPHVLLVRSFVHTLVRPSVRPLRIGSIFGLISSRRICVYLRTSINSTSLWMGLNCYKAKQNKTKTTIKWFIACFIYSLKWKENTHRIQRLWLNFFSQKYWNCEYKQWARNARCVFLSFIIIWLVHHPSVEKYQVASVLIMLKQFSIWRAMTEQIAIREWVTVITFYSIEWSQTYTHN